ncbi:MAG: DUF1595 domain-containing protein [Acidobacteria bacterium]|nr:DUF1595 domain-containing protein [Acidobacteriota bacterium]
MTPPALLFIVKPGSGVIVDQAARRILEAFLPRASRRPVTAATVTPYLALFRAAIQQGHAF